MDAYSHSIVSEACKPAWIQAFFVWTIQLYRHIYRQKTSALTGAGDAFGLRGDYSSTSIINYRRELEAPSKPLHPTFFPSRKKQRLIITKRHISSVFQPMKSKVKARQRQQVSSLVQLMVTFAFEFSLLHFTLNSSPRGRQACRRISLVLYLLRSTFLLRVPIERKISLANEDARPTGSAALH